MLTITGSSGSAAPLFVLGLLAVGGLAYYSYLSQQKRRQRFAELASQLGMQVERGDAIGLRQSGFGLFDDGRSRQVPILMRGPDAGAEHLGERCAFEYHYTTGSGKNREVHHFIAAMVNLPATVPPLDIGREHFGTTMLRAIGFSDIALESNEFNEAFRIKAADQQVAFAVLDGRLQEWLLAHRTMKWMNLELRGSRVLMVRSGLDIEGIPEMLTFLAQFRDQIPEVVSSMYPRAIPGGS